LVQVRSNRNIFCNVACVSFDYLERQAKGGGALSFVQCGAMSFSPDLPSDLPDQNHHLNQAREYLKKISDERGKVRDFSVVTRTLTDVLESNNAPETIDFLSLDVEGHELEVLAGIDFKKYVFTLILIESRNSENTKRYLSRYGYEFVRAVSPTDLLFKKHTSASP
jgi:predicted nucleotidyltransferase component of viral defense system